MRSLVREQTLVPIRSFRLDECFAKVPQTLLLEAKPRFQPSFNLRLVDTCRENMQCFLNALS
jgi:hypothetical protein